MGDEQTIIINDLLSFISCKIKLVPKENLIEILKKFYSESDIFEAEKTLMASLPEDKVIGCSQLENCDESLTIIYNCFQLIKDDDFLLFVCKDLNNVPDLDSEDQEVLLKDEISEVPEHSLEEEQKNMKSQISDIAFVVRQLRNQLSTISHQKNKKDENLSIKNTSLMNKNEADLDKKKTGLAYLQTLIDEDGNKSEYELTDDEGSSGLEDEIDLDLKLDPEDFLHQQAFFEKDSSELFKKKKIDKREKAKTLSTQVIYIKSEEDLFAEVNPTSIEIDEDDPTQGIDTTRAVTALPQQQFEVELMVDGESGLGGFPSPQAVATRPALGSAPSYACSICGTKMATQKRLEAHVKTHCVKKTFDCMLCDDPFGSKELLRTHYEQCLEVTKRKYRLYAHPCPTCGRLYAQERALKHHLYVHSESRPFACSQCTYRFLTKNALAAHVKTQHNSLNKYFCPFCDHSYISVGFLKIHLRSHTGQRPFACSTCGYRAATGDLLRRHKLTHAPPRAYRCDFPGCNFACIGIGKLSRHKAREHKRENIFCVICGKEFNNSCVYHRHYLSHVGARPYPCSICSYAAISREVLTVHMRTHTGDSIINCPHCGVPFGTKYSLKRHLKNYCIAVSGNTAEIERNGAQVASATFYDAPEEYVVGTTADDDERLGEASAMHIQQGTVTVVAQSSLV